MSEWTEETLDKLTQRYEELAAQGEPLFPTLSQEFDSSERTLQRHLRDLREQGKIFYYKDYVTGDDPDVMAKEDPAVQSIEDGLDKNGEYYIDARGPEIQTLQQLLDHGNDDLDKFDVNRYIRNRWPTTMKGPDDEPIQVFNWQVKAWFGLKKPRELVEKLLDGLVQDIAATAQKLPGRWKQRQSEPGGDKLLEIALFDLHLGNLVWSDEAYENWDMKIAERVFKATIADLLYQASENYNITRILYPIGNDFFHADNKEAQTTWGTPMDLDTRWHKMFRKGVEMQRWAIEHMRGIAPVDVVVVPGNHDELSSAMMGEVLGAVYESTEDVTIDNGPKMRKYYRFGETIIGFTHGNYEKEADLPMALAQEADQYLGEPAFSGTTFREFQIGHYHRRKGRRYVASYQDKQGVFVRILPTLTATDDWHMKKGFIFATQAAEAYIYDKELGLSGNLTAQRLVDTSDNRE